MSDNNSNEKKIETSPKITRRMERLIDEKCNLLSKSGISKEGTVHLAQWMKGQFNKQACASEPIESDEEENSQLQDWSEEDVKRRSTELHLLNEAKKTEETPSDDDQKSQKSASKSTTSDSQVKFSVSCVNDLNQCCRQLLQVTVRSSPITNNNSRSDSVSICRQCHKFCKKKKLSSPTNDRNNNKLKKSPSRQHAVDNSDSSNTIVEDSQASSLMEDSKELRTSQTMITINGAVHDSTIKTSQSSPSALQTHQKATPRMGVRVNFDSKSQSHKKSSSSLSSMCNCECKPKDFEKTTLSPDEVKHEIVKILTDTDVIATKMSVTESSSRSSDSPYSNYSSIRARTLQSKYSFLYNNNHMTAATKNQPVNIIKETMIGANSESDADVEEQTPEKAKPVAPIHLNGSSQGENESEDDLSLMLVDLAQLSPITSSVPTISVLPPTPDLTKQHNFNPTKDLEITKVNSISIKTESSFDSIDDDDEEPPYMALKTSLRRFGTLSSLERMQSEDTDEKTVNSSDEENSDGDVKIVDVSQTYRTWTSRAGSFLEESRAFIDKYLGRTDSGEYSSLKNGTRDSTVDFDEYETIEGESSGVTSGEEVWGTPTSGGENDEMHMFNNGDGNRSVNCV